MNLINKTLNFHLLNNRDLNLFFWAIFINRLGGSLINIFVPIYLFKLGFEIPKILLFYLLIPLYFIILSFPAAKITSKIGEKHSIILSTPFAIIYYISLIFLKKYDFLIYITPLFFSLETVFFNYGYHLNFIHHSDKNKIGEEIALLGIILLIANVSAPFLGGLIASYSFTLLIMTSIFIISLSNIPLIITKDKPEELNFSFNNLMRFTFSKKNLGNLISFYSYGIETVVGRVLWPIFLITTIGTISKTGFIISLSLLISLIAYKVVGKLTDKINKIKLLKIGTFLYVIGWIFRIFANSSLKILIVDSYKNLAEKLLLIPWSAHSYELAKKMGYFEFIVSREISFNFIRLLFIPLLIVIYYVYQNNFYMISFIIAAIVSIGYMFINKL